MNFGLNYFRCRLQDKELISEQQTVLRQLEAILFVHKLARAGQYVDALREITKLSFLPLNPRAPDVTADVFRNLSPHVQACVPDLLKIALSCIDNVADTDGTLRALKSKVSHLLLPNVFFYIVPTHSELHSRLLNHCSQKLLAACTLLGCV